MHTDDNASFRVLGLCMEDTAVAGGEFVYPEFGVYWPMENNQLFFFAGCYAHGTAELFREKGSPSRFMMTCSVPRLLWEKLAARGLPGAADAELR